MGQDFKYNEYLIKVERMPVKKVKKDPGSRGGVRVSRCDRMA